MKRGALFAAALAGCSLAGCISADTGYRDAQRMLEARGGGRAVWKAVDGTDGEAIANELLAKPLTEESAAQIALLKNPMVQAAFERIGLARAELVQAVRLPNPRAEGSVRFYPDRTEIEVGGSFDLTQAILIAWRDRAASLGLKAASLEAVAMTLDLVLEARVAFIECRAAMQTLELRKTATFAAASSTDLAKRMKEAGNVTDLMFLRQEAMYAESRIALDRAELDAIAAKERLVSVMGLWGSEVEISVSGSLADPPALEPTPADPEAAAIASSLDLEALRLRYAEAAANGDAAIASSAFPDIELGVTAETDDQQEWGVGPHVSVGLPIFNQGQGGVAASESRMRRTRSTLDGVAIRIRSAARVLSSRVASTGDRARYFKSTMLPLRARLVDETLRHYNAMNVSAFELLDAKRQQLDTTVAYLGTLRDYWVARASLQQLLLGRMPTIMPMASPSSELGSMPVPTDGDH